MERIDLVEGDTEYGLLVVLLDAARISMNGNLLILQLAREKKFLDLREVQFQSKDDIAY